jgi:predicted DNA-binding transcriptional regulator AlpA
MPAVPIGDPAMSSSSRSGTKVAQLVATFGMSEATIYNWLRQEQID